MSCAERASLSGAIEIIDERAFVKNWLIRSTTRWDGRWVWHDGIGIRAGVMEWVNVGMGWSVSWEVMMRGRSGIDGGDGDDDGDDDDG